jgi:hypothetical protein
MLNKRGFTLIEVLVSAVILWITVFWILRLSTNNATQALMIEKNKEMSEIFYNTRECVKSFWYNYLNSMTGIVSVNFWADNNSCMTWSYDTRLSFPNIRLNSFLDTKQVWSNDYWSYIKTTAGTWNIIVNAYINNWNQERSFSFTVYK